MGKNLNNIRCENCGASDFSRYDGQMVCNYCDSIIRYSSESEINLDSDVQQLLIKMQNDPRNARRYANLILDIDPTNTDINKYL